MTIPKSKHFSRLTLCLNKQALKVTIVYLLFGFLWILLSDKFVEIVIKNRSQLIMISIIKGWVYVIITAWLIYYLVSNALKNEVTAKEKIVKINNALEHNNQLLEKANTLYSSIMECSPEFMFFALDKNYCYMAFNRKHFKIVEYTLGKSITPGISILDISQNHSDHGKLKKILDRALSGDSFTFTEKFKDNNGPPTHWQNYFSPLIGQNNDVIGVNCFMLNITERVITEERNVFLSFYDPLTGMYNRRFYEAEVKRLDIERNLPISLLIGDVNGLKIINDAFGHQSGDELLKKTADIIKNSCRSDDIIARWGGDEFVILMPSTNAYEAENIVNRIMSSFTNEYVNGIPVSASFGWDTKENPEQDILKVLKNAEDMMYKHKMVNSASFRSKVINTIINTLHEKNPNEEQHSKRVAEISLAIGKAMNLSETELNRLKAVGLLHDIGKIAVESYLLNKNGRLTEQEYAEIRCHPEIGFRILGTFYEMQELAEGVLCHHERWDGKGYPQGLSGESIPLFARIIALADSYDAMSSERSYRKPMNKMEVIDEIRRNAGHQFDPGIARIFIEQVLGQPWQ